MVIWKKDFCTLFWQLRRRSRPLHLSNTSQTRQGGCAALSRHGKRGTYLKFIPAQRGATPCRENCHLFGISC